MWRGYEYALASYGIECCVEWLQRGYKDSLLHEFHDLRNQIHVELIEQGKLIEYYPPWLREMQLQLSHQSNLLRKYPEYYKHHFAVHDDLPYYWPNQ